MCPLKKPLFPPFFFLLSLSLSLSYSFSLSLSLLTRSRFISQYRDLSSNTSSSALTVADGTEDESWKDYEQKKTSPSLLLYSPTRTERWRVEVAQVRRHLQFQFWFWYPHRSSRAPTSSGWFLLQPSLDTTAGEENGPMGTMTMVKLVKRRRRVVSSVKNARISSICEFIQLPALQLLFRAICFGETSLYVVCPVRDVRRS